ncbi:MAG: hypothetical protein IKF36_00400 [Bacilli bacterium]|nr:hypothetical protein [Bacilli bacterium]
MDIKSRVVNYYKNNQFIQNYLKGIDSNTNEILLEYNGNSKRVSIDVLEAIKSESDLINYINGVSVQSQPVSAPSVPVVNAEIVPEPKEQIMLTESEDLSRETLNDIKILTELKNKEGLNNLIKKIGVNPSTGLLDINEAISKVTRNTMDEVEKAIRSNYEFDTNLVNYDVDGKYVGTPFIGSSSEDEKIMKAFNNVRVYLDASKMYSEQANYNDAQVSAFMKKFVDKVKEELHGSVSVPVNGQAPVVTEVNNKPLEEPAETSASAGFADIFVLTVIVLVYAAIIVNLVIKLK